MWRTWLFRLSLLPGRPHALSCLLPRAQESVRPPEPSVDARAAAWAWSNTIKCGKYSHLATARVGGQCGFHSVLLSFFSSDLRVKKRTFDVEFKLGE